eukprot:244563-Rhodomonas_salina.1
MESSYSTESYVSSLCYDPKLLHETSQAIRVSQSYMYRDPPMLRLPIQVTTYGPLLRLFSQPPSNPRS